MLAICQGSKIEDVRGGVRDLGHLRTRGGGGV